MIFIRLNSIQSNQFFSLIQEKKTNFTFSLFADETSKKNYGWVLNKDVYLGLENYFTANFRKKETFVKWCVCVCVLVIIFGQNVIRFSIFFNVIQFSFGSVFCLRFFCSIPFVHSILKIFRFVFLMIFSLFHFLSLYPKISVPRAR